MNEPTPEATAPLQRTFVNDGGNILVRDARGKPGRCGIVEMLHLYDKNKSGCVVAAWEVRDIDGTPFPELRVIHDRLTATKYSFDIMEALRYGQELAELLVNSDS
jgi:hypothetical protein